MSECSNCGHGNPEGARFCNQCGGDLSVAAQPPLPRNYTPRHLAQRILDSAHALKGERKQVTVLFADVKGSTRLSEQAGAEHWHRILDRLFALLSAAVHRYEGSVNQYTGDGIMALFGAPIAHEDHALRAAHAALAIREQVREFADELRLQHGLNLSLRIGMNSGEVIVGAIGDDLRMDYTAQGHTVNLAARMEAIAEPGRVYLTRYTARLVDGYFRLRDLGDTNVAGVDEPLRVYELEAVGAISSRLDLSLSRGLSRFVGRQRPLAQMQALLDEVQQLRSGRVIAVSGNAGIGKSRLCHEFAQRCRARGIAVHTATAVPYADAMPYFPVQQLLRGYFAITADDDADAARRKIAGALLLEDDSARDALGLVFDFLGLGAPANEQDNNPPELRMQRLQALCARAVAAKAQTGVVLIEDVHWADAGSVEFLQALFACVREAPLLVICNHRSDYLLEWLWPVADEEIALDALDGQALDNLLADLIGHDPALLELRALIATRAAGNPYFVEEAVRALLEQQVLTGAPGAYQLSQPVHTLSIPDSVQAILAARIDRLPERDKLTLHAAAILGKSFRETWLHAVAGPVANDVHTSLQALVDSGFLHPEGDDGEDYIFCHPLMQEVAYASQLTDARQVLHAKAAQVLENELADSQRAGEVAVLLAHHWRQAKDYARAAQWDINASHWLIHRDVTATLTRLRSAVASLDRLEDKDAEVRHLAVSARAGIVRLASIVAIPKDEVERAYCEARALAEADQDRSGLAELLLSNAIRVLNEGSAGAAAALVDEAVAILEDIGDNDTLARFRIPILNVYFIAGELRHGLEVLSEGGSWVRAPIDVDNFTSRGLRGLMLAHIGQLAEGREELQSSLAVAERHDRRVSWISGNLVEVDYLCGRDEDSMRLARSALAAAEQFGSPMFASMAVRTSATAHFLQGDYTKAVQILEAGRADVASGAPGHQFEGVHLAFLAENYLQLGEIEAAREQAEAALDSSLTAGARLWEIRSRLVLAQVLALSDGTPAAVGTALRSVQDLIADTGATIFTGFCQHILALSYERAGDVANAAAVWQQARFAFTQSGASARAQQAAQAQARLEAAEAKA